MPTTDAPLADAAADDASREADLREIERGLDQLELALPQSRSRLSKIWSALWPKLAAVVMFFGVWELVVLSGWKEEYVIPPPVDVLQYLYDNFGTLFDSAILTMQRALVGYGVALVIGTLIGAVVARVPVLRSAVGSMITGLQTMPSIAWFPFAIILFKLSEGAILFVVVLGAAPSIANGLISGIDNIPPLLLRTGRVLGARGLVTLRHVILPAALPSFVAGLKQGWAFAWRSLLAGELLVLLPGKFTLGQQLQTAFDLTNMTAVIAVMMIIFVIGVVIDSLFFGYIGRWIRRRYGLVDEATR